MDSNKWNAGCAVGILNAPDPSFDPASDKALVCRYGAKNHVEGKLKNKRLFQKKLGLIQDASAPIFFWPLMAFALTELPACSIGITAWERHLLSLYLPTRTAIVLQRVER